MPSLALRHETPTIIIMKCTFPPRHVKGSPTQTDSVLLHLLHSFFSSLSQVAVVPLSASFVDTSSRVETRLPIYSTSYVSRRELTINLSAPCGLVNISFRKTFRRTNSNFDFSLFIFLQIVFIPFDRRFRTFGRLENRLVRSCSCFVVLNTTWYEVWEDTNGDTMHSIYV